MDLDKYVAIGVIGVFLLGPQRIRVLAKQLGGFVRSVKAWTERAKDQIESETKTSINWADLDPRQYDPRRIIKDALLSPGPKAPHTPATRATEAHGQKPPQKEAITLEARITGSPDS